MNRLAACLLLASCCGCGPKIEYEIRMRATEEGFSRSVSVQVRDGSEVEYQEGKPKKAKLPDDMRDWFSKIYGPGESVGESTRFEKSFTARTPNDIGGAGLLQQVPSDLGVAFVYHERFQGSYPTLADQTERREAIDEFLRYILGWLRTELRGKPGSDSVVNLVDQQVRTDLYDLQLLLEAFSYSFPVSQPPISVGPEGGGELQFLHFLIERGYLTLEDAAVAIMQLKSGDGQSESWWLDRLRAYLQREAGDSTTAETFAVFEDQDRLAASLRDYLRELPEYGRLRKEPEESSAKDAPDPLELLSESLSPVFPLLFYVAHDRVTLLLQLERQPVATNGEWDEEVAAVRWQWDVKRPGGDETSHPQRLPRVAMARWAEPKVAAQTDRFGQTLLTGSPLIEYCGWYAAIDADQADRWRSLSSQLSSLTQEQRVERLNELGTWDDDGDFPGWLNHVLKLLERRN